MTHPYTLLTGATGLLGRYLLRDLLIAGHPVATLVRGRRLQTAPDRIETILVDWERRTGRALPRPVILKGALEKPRLGLSAADRDWLRGNCGRVLHAAASLKFAVDPKDGEPWRTNRDGTRRLLDLCQESGIQEFHHVSTAYVAGQRTTPALETELEIGQNWANPYEESKVAAERDVRAAEYLTDLTVYRPSIIVGDSTSGYSSSFHGFYTPLRVAHALAPKYPQPEGALDFLSIFDLEGPEGKNLVPVDWVAAAIVRIFSRLELHGRTYHLTSPQPIQVREMQETFQEVLRPRVGTAPLAATAENLLELAAALTTQLRVYQSYWRHDPIFDSRNTSAALPDLPCPVLDRSQLLQLARFAVERNFGLPPDSLVTAPNSIATLLESTPARESRVSSLPPANTCIGLEVTGPGGGDWTFDFTEGRNTGCRVGRPAEAEVSFHLSSATFDQLSKRTLAPAAALQSGRVLVLGNAQRDLGSLEELVEVIVPGLTGELANLPVLRATRTAQAIQS